MCNTEDQENECPNVNTIILEFSVGWKCNWELIKALNFLIFVLSPI